MSMSAHRPATYDDVVALPEHLVGEIVQGDLIVSRRPSGPHAVGASALGGVLTPPFQFGEGGPGGRWILDEPELHLGDDVLVPNLAGWRRERLPRPPEGAFITVVPDWICEVLSPSTGRTDRTKKLPAYARHGVAHLWLIDPAAESLDVFHLDGGFWKLLVSHGGDESIRAPPFEAIEVRLGRLWGR